MYKNKTSRVLVIDVVLVLVGCCCQSCYISCLFCSIFVCGLFFGFVSVFSVVYCLFWGVL